MWSSKAYAILLTGISCIGTLTNFKSYLYIKATFNTNINIFSILAKDSLINTFCCGLFCITNIINIVDEEFLKNKIGCNVFCYGLAVPTLLGPVTSLMISLRRFFHLKYPQLLQDDSKIVDRGVSIGIGAVLIFCMAHLSFLPNEYSDLCLGKKQESNLSRSVIISMISINAPWFLPVVATIILDIMNHKMAKKSIGSPSGITSRSRAIEEERKKREKVARQATAINTVTVLVPWIVFTFIAGNFVDLMSKCMVLAFMFSLINALRNITKFACRVNQQVRQETVEDRRQREIQDAQQRRDERRAVLQIQDHQE